MRAGSPALDNLSFARRLLAYGAVLLADGVSVTARRGGSIGTGTLLVAFANLGDQLRMMNVWSRYAPAGLKVDIACNAPTREAFELFACVGNVIEFGDQGARSLPKSIAALRSSDKAYSRAFVPHPFFSRPIANAYALTHAASVCAIAGRGIGADSVVPLERSSWRTVYEAVARECFPDASPAPAPVLRRGAGLEYVGSGRRRVALHPATSAPARTLAPDQFSAIARQLAALGFEVHVLGNRSEEVSLREAFSDVPVTFVCGEPLHAVASLLAGAGAFVGIDSSMMQLADSLGVPSVVIYIATSPAVAGPFYTSSIPVVPSRSYEPATVEPEASWQGDPDAARYVDIDEIVAAVVKVAG